jgi:diguanylate cyclase (GGDEF)-like protein
MESNVRWSMNSPDGVLGVALLLALLALGFGLLYWRQRRHGQRLAESLERLTTRFGETQVQELPGLVNRAQFDEALDAAVAACDRGDGALTVMFLNVDNFNTVNDSHGYEAGDAVIAEIAQRVSRSAGPEVTVARMGADELLLLCPKDVRAAGALALKLVREVAQPMRVARQQVSLSCSIGLASYPRDGARPRLVGHASSAMRCVKLAGGGDYMVFEPRMAADTRDQAELLHDLRHAVANGELELYYQPKVRAGSLRVSSAEALLRWHHPVRGMVSPAVFIPIAERYGLIRAIGHWVIEEACRQAAEWRDSGLRMRVAINISATQLRADDFVDRLAAVLKSHRLKPSRFTCEITESVAMEDTQATQRAFDRLRRAGLRVSIDDFGVGQASLSYLRRLPAAELKIDASFVRGLEQGAEARSIVEAVVRLAHALKLRVVAEGVETEAQAELLIQLGCDELQGYLFAKPMPARAVTLWAHGQDDPARPRIADSLFHDTAPTPATD